VFDPIGIDIAGEHVVVRNPWDTPINLGGWTFHDAADNTHTFIFPDVTLAPGAEIRVWTKPGVNDDANLYWGHERAVWNNLGDTLVLKNTSGKELKRYSYFFSLESSPAN
jgi:hypothetical protein